MKKSVSLILSILLALALLCGCAVTEDTAAKATGYISLGDSIAAGYALEGYEADGNRNENSFAAKFAAVLGQPDYLDLAVSGADTTDLLALLDNVADTDAFRSAGTVTVAIGSNDILRPCISLMYQVVGVETAEEMIEVLRGYKASNDISALLGLIYDASQALKTDDVKAMLKKQVAQYKENIIKIVDKLNALCPDADIYLINYYNPYAAVKLMTIDIGSSVAEYLDDMNAFLAAHAYNNDKYTVIDVSSLDQSKTNVKINLATSDLSDIDPHPNAAGHEYIFEKLSEAYNAKQN